MANPQDKNANKNNTKDKDNHNAALDALAKKPKKTFKDMAKKVITALGVVKILKSGATAKGPGTTPSVPGQDKLDKGTRLW